MAETIGTAYIQIEPSTKGISGSISDALNGEASNAGKNAGNTLSGSFKKVLGGAALAGVAVYGAKIGKDLVSGAVEAFGEREQLVGGIETLFKNSSAKVRLYADEAYKTAGMSANEYMETVTSFSASLLQSLGGNTNLAADVANRAIIDMSDNSNKLGTSMESIQNAYNGFAKGEYRMLDNLKLGYEGTTAGMERLLEDASKMTDVQNKLGIAVDASDMSFANIVNAISVVQSNLEITGTTAQEAASTIQGSANSMKASWQNLLAGLGNSNADLNGLIDDLVGNVSNLIENVMPVISQALPGIVELVKQLIPLIAEQIPIILPQLIDIVVTLIDALVEQLPAILQSLGEALIAALPVLLDALQRIMILIVDKIGEAWTDFVEVAKDLMDSFKKGIEEKVDNVKETIKNFIGELVKMAKEKIEEFKTIGKNIANGLKKGIEEKWESLKGWFKDKVGGLVEDGKDSLDVNSPSKRFADEVGVFIPAGIAQGVKNGMGELNRVIDDMSLDIVSDSKLAVQNASVNASRFATDAFTPSVSGDVYSLIAHYLPILAEKDTNVTVNGLDSGSIFSSVRKENQKFVKSTSYHALA